ncbi:MAG: family 16 glycoside hydrolase [Verrucomicrobiota bacterium]|jgi:hypothetical protein
MRCFVFCFWVGLTAQILGAEIKIDFSDFATGQAPAGFHPALAGSGQPGQWKVIEDEVPSLFPPLTAKAPATTRRSVLAQLSQDPADNRFPMLIYDGDTFQDFKLSTRFKIVSGGAEQMAGIVFRFQNASNFYVVRASALGHNLRFYKMVNGQFVDPFTLGTNIAVGVWHTLTVQCEGTQINCRFDDALAMPLQVTTTFAAGKIGFWTMSDAVSYFDNTTIDYKPRVPAAQALVNGIMKQQPRILTLRLYALDGQGGTRIIASNDEKEIGQPGTDAEKAAITDGTVSFGKSVGVVAVTLALRDRNGDPMAALRVRLKSFPGETQDNAVARATLILHQMQAQVSTSEDLMQ